MTAHGKPYRGPRRQDKQQTAARVREIIAGQLSGNGERVPKAEDTLDELGSTPSTA